MLIFFIFLFYFQDNLLEKLDDVELEAPTTQDEEVRISRLLEGEWGIRLLGLQSVTPE